MIASSAGGTSDRTSRGLAGSRALMSEAISASVAPLKAGVPVAIS